MTIPRRSVLLAMVGLPTSLALATTARPAWAAEPSVAPADGPATAYIDVSVATLWVSPGKNRPVDLPSTTNPADPAAWMAAMSLADRLWLVGELETQATYGQAVRILQEAGDWVNVAVVGQPTPRNALGYPGWLPRAQLASGGHFAAFARKPFATVTSHTAKLYDGPQQTAQFMELSFNTRLPVLSRTPRGVHVVTPSAGTKWLRDEDVAVYGTVADIPRPGGADLIATASMFLGLHYLWAGVSSFGFDCSGFTSTVYSAHGITIPRDTGPQFAGGVPVARDDLRAGDLIFFAHDNGTGSIHHVGISTGDGDIIDTPTNTATVESGVERVRLADHRYINEYAGAVRYL
jgi:cell wall-associated NlpC family hydrolase